jgi:hypothetical protein
MQVASLGTVDLGKAVLDRRVSPGCARRRCGRSSCARASPGSRDPSRRFAYPVLRRLRHLGIVEHRAGHFGQARRHLEESTRLRRRLGFGPGVAANLVGLAYLAAADGRDEEVPAILDEADCIASGSDPAGITRQIEVARRGLTR